MFRYVALVWDPHRKECDRQCPRLASAAMAKAKAAGWDVAFRGSASVVLQTGARPGSKEIYRLHGNRGVILGKLFARKGASTRAVTTSLDEARTRLIVDTGAQDLVDNYWGSYVAILHDQRTGVSRVLRSPAGSMPCYRTRCENVDIFFSHVDDCLQLLPVSFSTNRNYLARWLLIGRLIERQCGLDQVEDMTGGECLVLSHGSVSRAVLWNPIEIARTPSLESPSEAAQALRSTVQTTIDAWAGCYDRIAHKLSGGLDSSIVAACLAQAPSRPALSFIHMVVDVGFDKERLHLPGVERRLAAQIRASTGPGDERHFARLMAARLGKQLVEMPRQLSMDLSRLWDAPLSVSPSGYFSAMEGDDVAISFAQEYGTQAFFTGQAGDTVFFTPTQPLPAIDYAFLHGLRPGLWHHVVCTSLLSQESVWRVLGKAIWYGILRRPWRSAFSIFGPPNMLTAQLADSLSERDFTDLWSQLAGASDLPPGKTYHACAIGGSTFHDCVFHVQRFADFVDPLNSQPIWEVMMQIPTYTVQCGGISRGLARRAFADVLPTEIRKRQAKGTGSLFYQQLIRRNRGFLRERLLDGLLVNDGYLDRGKIEAYLAADEPFATVGALDFMCYLAAEVWLQQWTTICQSRTAASCDSTPIATSA